MGLVQCRGIGDPLTALLRGKGIDQQMRRADESLRHRSRGLNRHEFIQPLLVEAAAELGQCLGQDEMGLCAVRLDLAQATGIHHRDVGAHTLTHVFIGLPQLVFEEFQG